MPPPNLLRLLARRVVSAPAVRPRLPSRFETLRGTAPGFGVEDHVIERAPPPARISPAAPAAPYGAPLADTPQDAPGRPAILTSVLAPLIQAPPLPAEPPAAVHPSGERRGDAAGDVHLHVATPAPPAPDGERAPPAAATPEPVVQRVETSTTILRVRHEMLTQLLAAGPPPSAAAAHSPAEPRRAAPPAPAVPAPPPRPDPAMPPPIEITIGRIEIRGGGDDAPRAPARSALHAPVPALPLAEYLRRRDGRHR